MIRDRCPLVVNYALKWCKAKERWIDHVYRNFTCILVDKKDRAFQTRKTLGIRKGKPRDFDFHKTIDWDNLTEEEYNYWSYVESWVNWFKVMYPYVEDTYKLYHYYGEDDNELKNRIITSHLRKMLATEEDPQETKEQKYIETCNFYYFLVKCFESRI